MFTDDGNFGQFSLLDSFFSDLFASPALSLQFPSQQFRNKIAYTLGAKFGLSELALPKLNSICQDVQDFREKELDSLGLGFSPHCLNEVVVQMCRSGGILLKLVMVHETKEERALWEGTTEATIETISNNISRNSVNPNDEQCNEERLASRSPASVSAHLCAYLLSRHSEIKTIAMQWSPGRAKSRKGEGYETVFGEGFVSELTSTGAQYCLGMVDFSFFPLLLFLFLRQFSSVRSRYFFRD
jgi:hypothetical protein